MKKLDYSSVSEKSHFNCVVKFANWIPTLKHRSNEADTAGVYCAMGITGQNKCVFTFRNINFE